tara:strand:- start:3226 stop:3447 length:222 start_codon:yes stop_codon:yes gene_type:complete
VTNRQLLEILRRLPEDKLDENFLFQYTKRDYVQREALKFEIIVDSLTKALVNLQADKEVLEAVRNLYMNKDLG